MPTEIFCEHIQDLTELSRIELLPDASEAFMRPLHHNSIYFIEA